MTYNTNLYLYICIYTNIYVHVYIHLYVYITQKYVTLTLLISYPHYFYFNVFFKENVLPLLQHLKNYLFYND